MPPGYEAVDLYPGIGGSSLAGDSAGMDLA
jgi:hypothetical protein